MTQQTTRQPVKKSPRNEAMERTGELPGAGDKCFDELGHTMNTEFVYKEAVANCGRPSPEDEASALIDARRKFHRFAAKWCEEGKCRSATPGLKCVSSVTGLKSKVTGTDSRPNPNNQNLKDCIIKVEISGNISCACAPVIA